MVFLYRLTDGLCDSSTNLFDLMWMEYLFIEGVSYDIWSIQIIINELEPLERKKKVMMCGLWFGQKKPIMNEFLVPFVDELKKLQKEGLKWKDTRHAKITLTTKVFTWTAVMYQLVVLCKILNKSTKNLDVDFVNKRCKSGEREKTLPNLSF